MTVDEARKKLEELLADSAAMWVNEALLSKTVDSFASAVRAEALEPATRGRPEELVQAMATVRGIAKTGHEFDAEQVVFHELDRLRAARAKAEHKLADVRACMANHVDAEKKLREAYAKLEAENASDKRRQEYADLAVADLKVRCELAKEENAELRKLCGRAVTAIDRWRKGETYAVDSMRDELEAAARRAGK